MKGPALVVMARAPVTGQAKTRLQPYLTPGQCASLSNAFLRDTIDLATSVPHCTAFLAFTPLDTFAFFQNAVPKKMPLRPQTGNDIGQRMCRMMAQLEIEEYSPVVLIGSDIPTLQPATIASAFEALNNVDLCLGPSQDGGYYLIGARRIEGRIFQGIQWSTPRVLAETVSKAKETGLSLTLLEDYEDVDTFADLQRLPTEIKRLRNTPEAKIPLHTAAWLQETVMSSNVGSHE